MKMTCAAKRTTIFAIMFAVCVLTLADLVSGGSGGRTTPLHAITLAAPSNIAYAESSGASFLDNEAGMSIYMETGQALDLWSASGAYKTIEAQTAEYIIGSVSLPGLTETDDVHCYIQADGLIVVYYFSSEPASKIIDWNFYYDGNLASTKLQEGLTKVCNAMGIMSADAHYYDFRYPYATDMMIVLDDDSFNITIPATFTVYERSWSHEAGSIYCGILSAAQLSPGTTHLIELEKHSGSWPLSSSHNDLRIDDQVIDTISNYQGQGAIMLLYRNPQ